MSDRIWRGTALTLTLVGFAVVLMWAFAWTPGGITLQSNQYLYLLLAIFLPLVFIFRRARSEKVLDEEGPDPSEEPITGLRVPWYDALLALLAAGVNLYFAVNAQRIVDEGWDFAAPQAGIVAAFLLWALVLETLRRTAGLVVTVIAGVFSLYPLVAGQVPVDFLSGVQFDVRATAQMHAFGGDSIMGLPLQAGGTILVGFIFFGVVLHRTGGADFFVDLSRSIFGWSRGGSAKVCVSSSAAMGMMSGSAVSNVLTTGPMTIPTMKKAGYPAVYAGGIEATAASGGSITPPIMGTAAFIMVSFVGVPYSEVAIAAAIPALLYYLGIFVQVDGYAAKQGLTGEQRSALPRFWRTTAAGWMFIGALALLTVLLVWRREELQAPWIVTALLIVIAMVRKSDRMTLTGLRHVILEAGRSIAEIIGIIAGIGLIVGGLTMSGVSLSLARELVAAVGDNVLLILIAGAITSFILGMGMTLSAVYVFLAIIMAPALVELGVNVMAAHLFVIYWAAASYITPPVALAAFAAAGIARTPPMQTGFMAMRLGMVKYVIPFCFALNPALVAQGSGTQVAIALVMSIIGVAAMAGAFEGWMPLADRRLNLAERVVVGLAGLAMLAPQLSVGLIGLAVILAVVVWARMAKKPEQTERNRDEEQAMVTAG